MYHYGFELEGWAKDNNTFNIILPPDYWPKDGFPGLVELRTSGGNFIEIQYNDIVSQYPRLFNNPKTIPDFHTFEHTFSPAEKAEMRRKYRIVKDKVDIRNIYNKNPKALGNRTLASLQINISNIIENERTIAGKDGPIKLGPRYGLLDTHRIVKRLDEEFKEEIENSKRQPGFYALKEHHRLEYRSLPNSVFTFVHMNMHKVIDRIKNAVEG